MLYSSHYVDKLKKLNKDDSSVSRTTFDTTLHLSQNEDESVS